VGGLVKSPLVWMGTSEEQSRLGGDSRRQIRTKQHFQAFPQLRIEIVIEYLLSKVCDLGNTLKFNIGQRLERH
jgi:hypothetical protein